MPPPDQSPTEQVSTQPTIPDVGGWQKLVSVFTSIAGVILAAVSLPLERAMAGMFLVLSALGVISLALPWRWHVFHRAMTVVMAALLGSTGVVIFMGQGGNLLGSLAIPTPSAMSTVGPTVVPPATASPSPSVKPSPDADGRKTVEASTLLAALRPNDQNIVGSIASGVSYEGRPTLEIRFAKVGTYYEAYFDLKRLVSGRKIGRFSCFVNVGSLKSTDASWGGIVFMDASYKHDYGADVVFHDAPGDWIELEAVLGTTTEMNRTGGQALYEAGFQLSEGLNGAAIFFNSYPDPDLYRGKVVYVSACMVWPAAT